MRFVILLLTALLSSASCAEICQQSWYLEEAVDMFGVCRPRLLIC